MWRWVRRTCTRRQRPAIASPSSRIPVPASRISSLPSSPETWTHGVFPPNPAAALGPDVEPPVGGPALAHGDGHRQLVVGHGASVLVEGTVLGAPLLTREAAGLLEAAADHLRGGLVEEGDVALRVDQKAARERIETRLRARISSSGCSST